MTLPAVADRFPAIILAGVLTAYTMSAWPDLIVGVGIAIMNAGAAGEVYKAARKETDMTVRN